MNNALDQMSFVEANTCPYSVWHMQLEARKKWMYYFEGFGKGVQASAVCVLCMEMFCKEWASAGSFPGNRNCARKCIEAQRQICIVSLVCVLYVSAVFYHS